MRPPDVPRQSVARAFLTAAVGWRDFARERNSRIQLAAAVVATVLGIVLGLDRIEGAVLTLTVAGVLALEAMNCAIERVVDLASPGRHELARQAKDLAAGAVLIATVAAVVVGGLLFVPHLVRLFPH